MLKLIECHHCQPAAYFLVKWFLKVFLYDYAKSHSNLPDRHSCLDRLLGSWSAFLLSAVLQPSDDLV